MDTSRGTWQEVGTFGNDCHAKILKLTPNKEYKFRVKAVNVQGESKPLDSVEIVAKNEFGEFLCVSDYTINGQRVLPNYIF